MAGQNRGAVYTESYGTSSPVTGSAPTDPDDGQPMNGLYAITPVVTAAVGVTLSGAGTLDCYMLDPSLVTPDGVGVADGDPDLLLAYDNQTANFTAADIVYGGTSLAHAEVVSDADAGAAGVLTLTDSVGTFVNNEPLAVPHATADGALSDNWFLAYDGGTGLFVEGEIVTGATSMATAEVVAVVGNSTSGVLELTDLSGTFQNNENLAGDGAGAAVADLVNYKTLDYDAQTVDFTAAQVVYGLTSGAFGTIQTDTDGGTTGTLNLKTITGTFVDDELLGVGYALANEGLYQTIDYDSAGPDFEVGQTVTGGTSGASGTLTVDSAGTLTITGTGSTLFEDGETLTGVSSPRWARSPTGDVDVDQSGTRDLAGPARVLGTPRNGRIKWVPNGVTFSAGSDGVEVTQLGQTYNNLRNQGAA